MDAVRQHLQGAGIEVEQITFSAGFCLHSHQQPDFLKDKLRELGYRVCYVTSDQGMSIVWFDIAPEAGKARS